MKPTSTAHPVGVRYFKEDWYGQSRDGQVEDGEGYHFLAIQKDGLIIEAFEYYETDEGEERISSVPELRGKNWLLDLGYDDFEPLEEITERVFLEVREASQSWEAK